MHVSLLVVFLWLGYAVNLATPGLRDRAGNVKGADFLHFYTAARLLRSGQASDLYNPQVHAAYQKAILPESTGAYFVPMYGPQVYLLFEPLASLAYGWAAVMWALVNCAIYFSCCYGLWRACPQLRKYRYLVALLAAGYPAFFSLIAFGQSSAPALALFTLAFFAFRAQQPFLAGVAIGSLIYKPQLGLAVAVIFVASGEGKAIAGTLAAIAAQLGLAWTWFGGDVMRRYGDTFLRLGSAQPFLEPKLFQMHSLRSFAMLLLPFPILAMLLYLITAAAVLLLGAMCWRKASDLRLRYAALLFCTVLVAPHLWIYDLVVLAPALLFLGDWILEHRDASVTPLIQILLYACYALPLLGPVAKVTRLQFSVVAFAALLMALWQIIHEPHKHALPAHG